MKINFLLPYLTVLALSSCTKDPSGFSDSPEPPGSFPAMEEETGICTELYDDNYSRAFGPRNSFWNKNTLRVRFLGGSSNVQSRIRQHVLQWSKVANIHFEFVSSEPSDIRISFDPSSGSWSYVGRSSSYIAANRATMNFGWFTDRTSDTEIRRTTLHEFGHALGLSHEHQHPLAMIPWKREAVYDYYQRTQGWSRSEVDQNIFTRYSTGNTNYTHYDPLSIMHYYIPRSLVNGDWNPTWNTILSVTDIDFIGTIYPRNTTENPYIPGDCHCPDDRPVIACEDFENHDQASFEDAQQWAAWSALSGMGEIQTYSWGKVLKMNYSATSNPDVLYKPGVLRSGSNSIIWKMYIGPGSTAYFNLQKFEEAGQEFGAQVFFDSDRRGKIQVNNRQVNFTYQQDRWLNIVLKFDFNQDLVTFQIDDRPIASWPVSWTATGSDGHIQQAALNFFAINENSRFWLDDFCVSKETQDGQLPPSAIDFTGAPMTAEEAISRN